jgi:hypothetical protein
LQVDASSSDPHHDLLNNGSDNPFAGRWRSAGTVPGAFDVGAERKQAFALDLAEHRIPGTQGQGGHAQGEDDDENDRLQSGRSVIARLRLCRPAE